MKRIDAETLQLLIDNHGAALSLYARQWCTAPDDAVQEALIALIKQSPPPDHVLPWLYVAVRRLAMNQARADSRRDRHQQAAGELRPWFVQAKSADETDVDYQALLERLPQLEREIVVARIWGELTFTQIAELVEQSVSSVHRRYHQAIAMLQQMIDPHEDIKTRKNHGSKSILL